MPKRTNAFQSLIAFIERASADAGARVVESPELAEYEDSSEREIDILVEHQVSGHPVRMAIECRDHKRKQSKQWIDELQGKYRDLGIPIVIAVSKSGFTKGALQKAKRVGIQTLTLEQALDEDWEGTLLKPEVKFRGTVRDLALVSLLYPANVDPPQDSACVADWTIQGPSGEDPETVHDTALRLYDTDAERLTEEYIEANGLDDFSKQEDRDFEYSIPYAADGRYVVPEDGVPRPLRGIELRIKGGVRFVDGSHERYRYVASLVTVASAQIENEPLTSVAIVQPSRPDGDSLTFKWGLLQAGSKDARDVRKPRVRRRSRRGKARISQSSRS